MLETGTIIICTMKGIRGNEPFVGMVVVDNRKEKMTFITSRWLAKDSRRQINGCVMRKVNERASGA